MTPDTSAGGVGRDEARRLIERLRDPIIGPVHSAEAAGVIDALLRERGALRQRIALAEKAMRTTIDDCKRQGVSFGRLLANYAAGMFERERDALTAERDRLAEAVAALDAAHAQAAREVERLTTEVAAREAAAAEAMRAAIKAHLRSARVEYDLSEDAAYTGRVTTPGAMFVPPIGEIPIPAADALARALERARAEEREACAQEADCGCAARADVLARLATDGEKRASYLCVHGDVCCALQAAAIRARGKEGA